MQPHTTLYYFLIMYLSLEQPAARKSVYSLSRDKYESLELKKVVRVFRGTLNFFLSSFLYKFTITF